MRIRISHLTTYRYDTPASSVIQMLRLTPRNHDGQYVAHWRIDVSADCRLDQHEDAFGNITHAFTADGPFAELRVLVEGEVETRDTAGHRARRGRALSAEPVSARDPADPARRCDHRDFAPRCLQGRAATTRSSCCMLLLDRLHDEHDLRHRSDPAHRPRRPRPSRSSAASARTSTHIFIAAARSLGIPARYVGGYFHRADGVVEQDAGHAWAEAFVPDLGWVAFDPANGICATDAHVRVAVGLDYLGAAPVRGTRYGGGGETLAVKVQVDQAMQPDAELTGIAAALASSL